MRLSLDRSWRFHLGDLPAPLANTHIAAYMNNKAGYARGPAKTNYDDSDWREVDLPHDWSVEGEFSPDNHLDAGYLPRGVGWYRKYLRLDESDRGKTIQLHFDGVATFATVYVNGHLLHRNFCGYTPFAVDISDVATFGDALNTIAVKVDATWMEGWWYEGAGIYRQVELSVQERVRFESGSLAVRPTLEKDGSWSVGVVGMIHVGDPSLIFISSKLPGASEPTMDERLQRIDRGPAQAQVRITLSDSTGTVIARQETAASLLARRSPLVTTLSGLRGVILWSPEGPTLYTARIELLIDGYLRDAFESPIGFRDIRFDADKGFFLNDQHTFLKGVCLHQDHAGVGVAIPDSIVRFRLLQLKAIGVNAIRCAHNPPSKVFLDLCDELGFLVMNEIRNFGSSPEHLRQLEATVRRDRNHPCIILWSVCNEEAIQGSPVAAKIARSMIDHLRGLDPTRPITGAVSGGIMDEVGLSAGVFDVLSVNYNLPLHDAYHAKRPQVPMLVSETGCTYATRGVTVTDAGKHHFAEDETAFAPWGATARATWEHIRARPYLAGMFVWTGIDYRGEPTPHEWPSVQSHWGLFDLCCFPKRAARLHEAFFTGEPEKPEPPRPEELTIELPEVMREVPIEADGQFTLPITIASPVDEPIEINIAGPGKLIGVGNGDPTSHVNKSDTVTPFNGLAQILVQTTTEPGRIVVRAYTAEGDTCAKSFISVVPRSPKPVAPVVFPRHLVTGWRMSPIASSPPDPNVIVSDQDMNTWERVDPRAGPQSAWARAITGGNVGHALYRAKLTLPKALQASGCTIRFHRVLGEAEAFIDGAATPLRDAGNNVLELDCPGSSTPCTLTVRLRASAHESGIAAPVELLPRVYGLSPQVE